MLAFSSPLSQVMDDFTDGRSGPFLDRVISPRGAFTGRAQRLGRLIRRVCLNHAGAATHLAIGNIFESPPLTMETCTAAQDMKHGHHS